MIPNTVSPAAAQRFYDRLGARYDWFGFAESRAKERALQLLDLAPGHSVLCAGTGTGREQARIRAAVAPGGIAAGVDLSPVMLGAACRHEAGPLLRADVSRLPLAAGRFDRVLAAYVLDLIALADLPGVLSELRRMLARPDRARGKQGGKLVAVSLTEGVDGPSRAIIDLWLRLYRLNPAGFGGCRPLRLAALVAQAGFCQVRREIVVQLGVPSEIVVALAGPEEGSPA